jgi:hypothetical protein
MQDMEKTKEFKKDTPAMRQPWCNALNFLE